MIHRESEDFYADFVGDFETKSDISKHRSQETNNHREKQKCDPSNERCTGWKNSERVSCAETKHG